MSIQSLIKRSKLLEEKSKWEELSEVYNEIGRIYSMKGQFDEALRFYSKDKDLCESIQDVRGQAQGKVSCIIIMNKILMLLFIF